MITENDKNYEVTLEALGLDKDDLDITIDNGYLNITAKNYIYGRYKQTIWLTDDIDEENIKAKCDKGLLTITLPKKKERQAKRIQVE